MKPVQIIEVNHLVSKRYYSSLMLLLFSNTLDEQLAIMRNAGGFMIEHEPGVALKIGAGLLIAVNDEFFYL